MRDPYTATLAGLLLFSALFALWAMTPDVEELNGPLGIGADSPGMSWAEYERSSSLTRNINYTLWGECDSSGFEYQLRTSPGEGGGGMVGGIGGGAGSNLTLGQERSYPEVRGEFLENMGIIYNSYKEKRFDYKIGMYRPPEDSGIEWKGSDNPGVFITVSLKADLIPWWVDGFSTGLTLDMEYTRNDLEGYDIPEENRQNLRITIDDVSIVALTDFDGDRFTGEERVLFSSEKEYTFREIGDRETIKLEAEYPEGTNVAGIKADINGEVIDYWGRSGLLGHGSGSTINIYPLDTSTMVKGLGIPLSWPLLLLSYLFILASVIVRWATGKWPLWLLVPAAALMILAPLWFFIGMNAAVDLLSERLEDAQKGLSFEPGFYIAISAAVLSVAGTVMAVVEKIRYGGGKGISSEKGATTFKVLPK